MKIKQEKILIKEMILLYCKKHKHKSDGKAEFCYECNALYEYAMQRLDHCKFSDNKPFCSKCPIHCYKKDRKEQIKKVMRFSGPRLFFYHPIIVLRHMCGK